MSRYVTLPDVREGMEYNYNKISVFDDKVGVIENAFCMGRIYVSTEGVVVDKC